MKNACYGCTERHTGCHSTCEKYIKFKKEHDEKAKLIRENRKKDLDIYEYHKDVKVRLNKKYHKKG
jgi:hypothetical protein